MQNPVSFGGLALPTVTPNYVEMFDSEVLTSGLDFTLVPTEHVTLGVPTNIAFCIPLPLGVATSLKQIRITNSSFVEQPSTLTEVLRWRDFPGAKLPRAAYLRSVQVRMVMTFTNYSPVPLKVGFNGRTLEANLTFDPSTTMALISTATFFPSEYSAGELIKEPIVIPEWPASWLCSCMTKTAMLPFGASAADPDMAPVDGTYQMASYTYPTNGGGTYQDPEALPIIEQFAKSLVNDVRPHVNQTLDVDGKMLIPYETAYEPWLYDRAALLWQVYLRTGKTKWYRHAHRATQFYKNHISSTGYFNLRADDLKYSYSLCMKLDYLLSGDTNLLPKVVDVAKPSLSHNPVYTYVAYTGSNSPPQWTERNTGYALLTALNAWEVLGDTAYSDKVTAIMDALVTMQTTPQNGWPATGGLWHTIMSHEGGPGPGTGNEFAMSPWMGAILIDAVMAYYMHSEDSRVLSFLSLLGDYYATHATRVGAEGEVTGLIFPKYFAGPGYEFSDSQSDLSDSEHTLDVLGAIYNCLWAKKQLGHSQVALQAVADDLIVTTAWSIPSWIRDTQVTLDAGFTVFRAAPPRKPGWWFNSTADLTYLKKVIDNG